VSKSGWKLAVVAILVVGTVVGVYFKLKADGDRINAQPTVAIASPRPGCSTLVVEAAPALEAPLIGAANSYASSGRKVGSRCFGVRIQAAASADVEAQLTSTWDTSKSLQPQVWIPESSQWLTHLASQTQANGKRLQVKVATSQPLTSSLLTVAMPLPMAQALGWPTASVGWSDLGTLAADPAGWGAKGHPEWGAFSLAKPNPTLSMAGLDATIGAFLATTAGAGGAATTSTSLDVKRLSDATVQASARRLEQAVLNYGEDPQTFLTNQRHNDDAGTPLGYASAIVTTEQSVVNYNNGGGIGSAPKTPLVAIYPKEGAFASDYPYATLDASWVKSDLRDAAKDFYDFLTQPAQQGSFAKAGFRQADGQLSSEIAADPSIAGGFVRSDGGQLLAAPSIAEINAVRDAWLKIRKPARVTLLLDISSGMGDLAANTETTKLQVAQSAAVNALGQLSPDDEVGLTAFSFGLDSPSKRYRELVPIGALNVDKSQIMTQLSIVVPHDQATLYAATSAVSKAMSTDAEDDHINAVVLVSGAKDADPDNPSLDKLVQELSSLHPRVQLFTIGFSKDADLSALQALSSATDGTAYDASDTSTVEAYIRAAFASL